MGPNGQKARRVCAISAIEAFVGNMLVDDELTLVRQLKHASGILDANATGLSIRLCHPAGFLIRQLQHLRIEKNHRSNG
jgi:hypothetical protein